MPLAIPVMLLLIGAIFAPGAVFSANVQNVWTEAPQCFPSRSAVDAPLMGNGDALATVGYRDGKLLYYFGKNDFWRLKSQADNLSGPRVAAVLEVTGDEVQGAAFSAVQELSDGETVCTLKKNAASLTVRSLVCATENVILLEFTAVTESAVTLNLTAPEHPHAQCETGASDGVRWLTRAFTTDVDIPTKVAVAMKILGDREKSETSITLHFQPGKKITMALAMDSLFKSDAPLAHVLDVCGKIDTQRVTELEAANQKWWEAYWGRAVVELDEPVLMKAYRQGLYTMAACSRDMEFPPGIFGWTTTDAPAWNGDYHLNYNHNAPFYAMYGANRVEQGEPEDAPLLEFMPRGRWYAENVTHTRGILYPVGIGPQGIETTFDDPNYRHGGNAECGGLFFYQRSNAAYGVINMAQRWRCTHDEKYARKIYSYVIAVTDFWEDYLKFEDGRYIIHGDAIHEGSGRNKNPILSLGLVRNAFSLAMELSDALDLDKDRQAKWQHILDHMSGYTFQEIDGKKVFRYTEEGLAWWNDNGLGIQHIYPANAITLDSDPELLAVSRNTIGVMRRWRDFNTTSSFYVAAIRVGYDPQTVWNELMGYARHTWPNGFQAGNPHGIENAAVVANAVNEMLLMSAGNVLRLFVGLPEGHDARFENLRAWGAFLVSARREAGAVSDVKIVSEQGRPCTLQNPWQGRSVRLKRNGQDAETLTGERFTFPTHAAEIIELSVTPTGE